jgi:hypothetical protein
MLEGPPFFRKQILYQHGLFSPFIVDSKATLPVYAFGTKNLTPVIARANAQQRVLPDAA